METTDIKPFRQKFEFLCAAFDRQMSQTLIDVYFAGLADLTIEAITYAVEQSIKTCTFFPKVAELRALCEGTQTERSQRAWQLLMRAVEEGGHYNSLYVDDFALAAAIRRTFTHWIEIPNEVPPPNDPMHASIYNRFCANYRLAEKTAERVDSYFVGFYEATNRQQVSHFSLNPESMRRMADVVEFPGVQGRELPCVVETVSEPTFLQRVVVVIGATVEMREMEFSRTTGALTSAARASLAASPLIKQLPPTTMRQLTA